MYMYICICICICICVYIYIYTYNLQYCQNKFSITKATTKHIKQTRQ